MPNKFPSTNCFVITYIYVDARISILSVYVSRHRHTSATSLFLFLFSLRAFAHFQITLFPHVFLLILRYLRDVERGSEESEESEESEKRKSTRLLLRSNRIESNRIVSRFAEWRAERGRKGERTLLARVSQRGWKIRERASRSLYSR